MSQTHPAGHELSLAELISHAPWLANDDIRPYVFVRTENQIARPGALHKLNWFTREPVLVHPMQMQSVGFANLILRLEERAFGARNLQMPRWVFFDCAVLPGLVAGFAQKTSSLPASLAEHFRDLGGESWTPLSLFIIIPSMAEGEWVAHNLCAVNSWLPKDQQYPGLGFLSKAFGLWYANVEVCVGATQWHSPAMRLHSHYGDFEVLTAYTPVHSFSETMSYRARIEASHWHRFFSRQPNADFHHQFQSAGFEIDPNRIESMRQFQTKIEQGKGPFFLNAHEIKSKKLTESLNVYCPN